MFSIAPSQTAQDPDGVSHILMGIMFSYVRSEPANLYIRNTLRHRIARYE
jgi:hypothetical protein